VSAHNHLSENLIFLGAFSVSTHDISARIDFFYIYFDIFDGVSVSIMFHCTPLRFQKLISVIDVDVEVEEEVFVLFLEVVVVVVVVAAFVKYFLVLGVKLLSILTPSSTKNSL
jgi:hypothetical protein